MVNSGPADFYNPPDAALERALQEQPRRHVHRRHRRPPASVPDGFGMGCAVGDFDNDGYADILVTAYGPPTLYHNNGNGTFTDITEKSGLLGAPTWTTSAVWFDYDNDGRLDLFLCSFVEFSLKSNIFCGDNKLGKRFYCIPRVFKPTPSALFHNNGDGTFTQVSAGTDIEERPRQGARRRRHRHQRRRADGSVRRERHGAELPVREPRQGQVGGDRAGGRSRVQRQRHAAIGHGRRRDRLRRRRQAGSVRRQRRSGDVLALQERRQRVLLGRRRRQRRRAGDAAAERVGPQVLRLRHRRPRRPVPRQRPPRRHDRAVQPDGEVQGAAAAVPQQRHEARERQRGLRPGLHQVVPGARARHRRLQQRRPHRRAHRQQRRRAGAAEEQRRRRQPLGGAASCKARRATATPSARGSRGRSAASCGGR